jgi:polyisoprenoid-binding protein YceI
MRESSHADPPTGAMFRVDPERAAVLLVARSNAGPITFGTTGIEGSIRAQVTDGGLAVDVPLAARLTIPLDRLTSGNQLYDAELSRRVEARRFPTAVLELRQASPIGSTGRYHIEGELTFHGMNRDMVGTVTVSFPGPDRMVVEGEQVLDMRGFDITPPTVAMLRIFPEVRIQLHVEAAVEV